MSELLKPLLVTASDYRQFLATAFAFLKVENPKFSLGFFAKKCGFKSRSYPRDVILGQKRITSASLPKFIHGLGLKGDLAEYFKLLVELEEADIRTQSKTTLLQLQSKLRDRLTAPPEHTNLKASQLYRFDDWPKLYASLGDSKKGATLEDISRRSRLTKDECETVLAAMAENGVVTLNKETNRYTACQPHLVMDKLGTKEAFQRFFVCALDEAKVRAVRAFSNDLHLSSTVSIDSRRMEEFCAELKSLIHKFVDQVESPEGDRIATLVLSYFKH